MNAQQITKIADELKLRERQVQTTVDLLDDGATVPFIARYRKEMTGELDEVSIIDIRDRLELLRALDKRREVILTSLEEHGKLTDELESMVLAAETLAVLEDLYLPYRPKRRTRAMIAKEKGLEPLAVKIFEQTDGDLIEAATSYIDPEKGVETREDALAGARDIIAEWINEDGDARAELRELFAAKAMIRSKVIKEQEENGIKYRDYYEWEERAADAPSHRILAIRRGADEGFLTFHILPDEEEGIGLLERRFVKNDAPTGEQVRLAVRDGYKRLLSSSMETEIRLDCKKRADEDAIKVFAENLRELLLASPLGRRAVLAIDPGFRTGCKVVCLDRQGKLLGNETIYPIEPHNRTKESAEIVKRLVKTFHIEAIAVGNGTGGRETETFCKGIDLGSSIPVIMVNESGASVYSASEVARDEFPDYDVTVRGAVSIGRRLMDPLAELVKIDPKSIGVGQYQHDVDQKALRTSLDDVVMSSVNAVGVEVNTASKELLKYVSGLSERLAGNIVVYRNKNGAFRSRRQLLKVSAMGPKTFVQAAGFLRISDGEDPLDASAVHPESYPVVEAMARDLECTVSDLMNDEGLRKRIRLENYVSEKVGMPTLTDIMDELAKPGRDPRNQFELFAFMDGINKISDLEVGMALPGVVTNVTAFGAFVDIGVHQDGLVHVSEMADRFVKNPHDVLKVNQKVAVTVIDVDEKRNRIALSMRERPFDSRPKASEKKQAEQMPEQKTWKREGKKKKEPMNPFAKALKHMRIP